MVVIAAAFFRGLEISSSVQSYGLFSLCSICIFFWSRVSVPISLILLHAFVAGTRSTTCTGTPPTRCLLSSSTPCIGGTSCVLVCAHLCELVCLVVRPNVDNGQLSATVAPVGSFEKDVSDVVGPVMPACAP